MSDANPARGSTSPAAQTCSSRREEIAKLGYWFHNLHLPDGTQTVPDHHFGDFPKWKWEQFADQIPADLTGWSALDIGCNAGFYTFELAKRGARVTAIDTNPMYLDQAKWAARQFGLDSRIEFRRQQIYDLSRDALSYDIVLFLGVFYHLRYPLLALDIVRERASRIMVFQTLAMPGEEVSPEAAGDVDFQRLEAFLAPGWPKLAFIEKTFCRDPTNWWAPNHAGVLALLSSAGFDVLGRPAPDTYICAPALPKEVQDWRAEEFEAATGRSAAPVGRRQD